MADERLKIDNENLHTQAADIKEAVEQYKQFGENPFSEELTALEEMNTDFTAKFKTMLEDLDDGNSKSVEALEEIAELTEEILETFEKIDEDAAASMGFERED